LTRQLYQDPLRSAWGNPVGPTRTTSYPLILYKNIHPAILPKKQVRCRALPHAASSRLGPCLRTRGLCLCFGVWLVCLRRCFVAFRLCLGKNVKFLKPLKMSDLVVADQPLVPIVSIGLAAGVGQLQWSPYRACISYIAHNSAQKCVPTF